MALTSMRPTNTTRRAKYGMRRDDAEPVATGMSDCDCDEVVRIPKVGVWVDA